MLSFWKAVKAKAEVKVLAKVKLEAILSVVPEVDHIPILPIHGPGQDLGHTQDQDHTLLILQQNPNPEQDLLQFQEGEVLPAFWIKEE